MKQCCSFFLNLYKVYVPHSLGTADAFPIVASLRSDLRKCVFCSQALYSTSYDIGWSLHVHIFSGILLHGPETCHLFIIAHSLVLREHSHQEKAVTSEFRWSCHLGSRQYGWFEWRVESQLVHCSGSYSLLFNHQMSILFLVLAFSVRVLRSPLLSQPAV